MPAKKVLEFHHACNCRVIDFGGYWQAKHMTIMSRSSFLLREVPVYRNVSQRFVRSASAASIRVVLIQRNRKCYALLAGAPTTGMRACVACPHI